MYEKELEAAIEAVKLAEVWIKKIYNSDFDVEIKSDDSPVTAADKGADDIMREYLGKKFPEYGFLTEESKDTKERLSKKSIWIIDPVDGTKDFVSRDDEFTTNVALAVDHEVVVGVINIPMLNTIYYGIRGQGAFRMDKDGKVTRIHVSEKLDNLIALKSRSFFNEKEAAWLERHKDKVTEVRSYGAAVKFCRIAEGEADIQMRISSSTKEWDVAAGDIILSEAGGAMIQPDGTHFRYNRDDVYNRNGYILVNRLENLLW